MSLKHKNLIRLGAFVLLSALLVETAHAANPFGDILGGVGNDAMSIVGLLIMIATTLSFIFFNLLNVFLNPTAIFDLDAQNQNLFNTLNMIWQLSRDIMNVIFAFVLAGVAVYMVVTAKKDFIKEYLGKFVMAVILVNFSWFASFLVLDIAHVIAATIFDIPMLLLGPNPQFCTVVNGTPVTRPYEGITDMAFFVAKCPAGGPPVVPCFPAPPPVGPPAPIAGGWECVGGGIVCYKTQAMNFQTTAGHASILNGLIINHASLRQMANVPDVFAGVTPFITQMVFLIKMGIIVVLAFSLLFPLAAMTVAMFIRIPVLWITIAFMPFVFLAFIGGDKLQQFIGDKGPKAIWETFLKFAFLPALVGIPLAIGFILIQAGAAMQCTGGLGGVGTGAAALQAMRLNLPMASNLYDLIWLIMSNLVLWIGVFSVLKGTPIVGGISQKIADAGKTVGRLAYKLPLATPIFPAPAGSPPGTPGTSLLQMAPLISPKVWESTLSQSGNLTTALDAMRKRARGETTSAAPQNIQQSATHLNNDSNSADRESMRRAINDLATAVRGNAPDRDKQIDAALKAIHAASGNNANVNRQTIESFLRGLNTNPALSQANRNTIGLTDATIKQIANNINNPPTGGTPPANPNPNPNPNP